MVESSLVGAAAEAVGWVDPPAGGAMMIGAVCVAGAGC